MAADLDDITRRRLAIEQAKEARRAAKIAESIAKREAVREQAAATCADPDVLADHIRRSIDANAARAVLGDTADERDDDTTPSPGAA
jgi:hypothetical protein